MSAWAAIAQAAAENVNTAVNYASARQTQLENLDAARDARHWSEYMSSTAHQREVADLRAAGLNPLLSAMGGMGAATPGASMAQNANSNPAGASSVGQTFNAAKMANENFQAELELNSKLADAEIKLKEQEANKVKTETLEQLPAAIDNIRALTNVAKEQIPYIRGHTALNETQRELAHAEWSGKALANLMQAYDIDEYERGLPARRAIAPVKPVIETLFDPILKTLGLGGTFYAGKSMRDVYQKTVKDNNLTRVQIARENKPWNHMEQWTGKGGKRLTNRW